jgi:hypothetical protein
MRNAAINPESVLTSNDVAKLLQCDASSINKWHNKGLLVGYKTPGGHRRFSAPDVVAFCVEFGMPVPAALRGES